MRPSGDASGDLRRGQQPELVGEPADEPAAAPHSSRRPRLLHTLRAAGWGAGGPRRRGRRHQLQPRLGLDDAGGARRAPCERHARSAALARGERKPNRLQFGERNVRPVPARAARPLRCVRPLRRASRHAPRRRVRQRLGPGAAAPDAAAGSPPGLAPGGSSAQYAGGAAAEAHHRAGPSLAPLPRREGARVEAPRVRLVLARGAEQAARVVQVGRPHGCR
mmetsp:Transcript_5108/g.15555  ORF Transcript_5108/g.15555 Transcript_5108/m.15555 type:complete len:221 (-) Transcript_5108:1663-2325(-)